MDWVSGFLNGVADLLKTHPLEVVIAILSVIILSLIRVILYLLGAIEDLLSRERDMKEKLESNTIVIDASTNNIINIGKGEPATKRGRS